MYRMLRIAAVNWRDHFSKYPITICTENSPGFHRKLPEGDLGLRVTVRDMKSSPWHHFISGEPNHRTHRPGRPAQTFVDTLKRDVGVANTAELDTCMNVPSRLGFKVYNHLDMQILLDLASY